MVLFAAVKLACRCCFVARDEHINPVEVCEFQVRERRSSPDSTLDDFSPLEGVIKWTLVQVSRFEPCFSKECATVAGALPKCVRLALPTSC